MVYALGLYGYSKDHRFKKLSMNNCPDYEFREVIERNQEVVMVAKSKLPKFLFVEGKFEVENLSVEVAYEIYWLIMFERSEYPENVLDMSLDELQTSILVYTSLDKVMMITELTTFPQLNEWIRIPGGEIKTDATMEGLLELRLSCDLHYKDLDMIVKGFIIQPKPEMALV